MADPGATVELGRQVLRLEGAAVEAVADRLDERFDHAVRLLARAAGRVIVTGVGKSGLVARKIAATLTSTGTPASYLHPIDSLHGDLGIVGPHDVALVLSKSGDSQDLFGLVGSLQRLGVPIIAITGALDSPLARVATVVLDGSVAEEACPYDLAPTASTTVAMALGDALAVALLERKGFRPEDFAALHPGGSLGRRLLLRVRDVMLPPGRILPPEATMRDAVVSLAHDRGLALIGTEGRLDGCPHHRRPDAPRRARSRLSRPSCGAGDDPITEDHRPRRPRGGRGRHDGAQRRHRPAGDLRRREDRGRGAPA